LSELKEAGLIKGEFNPPKIKYCIRKGGWEEAKRTMNIEVYGKQMGKALMPITIPNQSFITCLRQAGSSLGARCSVFDIQTSNFFTI